MMLTSSLKNRLPPTILIGLGNPILGDDGVGWRVADAVRELLLSDPRFRIPIRPMRSKVVEYYMPVEIDLVSLGGLSLMERLVGYQKAILVDSMETGQFPVGSVRVFLLEDLPDPSAGHSASAHDASLLTALESGRAMGLDLPAEVNIVAIEARKVFEFSEGLSHAVAAAVPLAVQATLELLLKI